MALINLCPATLMFAVMVVLMIVGWSAFGQFNWDELGGYPSCHEENKGPQETKEAVDTAAQWNCSWPPPPPPPHPPLPPPPHKGKGKGKGCHLPPFERHPLPRPPGGAIGGSGCNPIVNYCGPHQNKTYPVPWEQPQPYYHFIDYLFYTNGWLIFEYRGKGVYILPIMAGWFGGALLLALCNWLIPYCWMDRPWWLPKPLPRSKTRIPTGPTTRQAVMITWYIGIATICGAYLYNHAKINNLVSVIGRAFGGALIPIFCWQILPILKSSFVPRLIFGTSFERALVYHRVMGYFAWLLMTFHLIAMFIGYVEAFNRNCGAKEGPAKTNIYASGRGWILGIKYMFLWDNGWPHGPPLAGLLCWILFTLMLAFTFIRRKSYEVFIFTHMVWPFMYFLAIIHYPTTILFLALPITLYFLDHVLQRWNSIFRIASITYYERAGITAVHCDAPTRSWTAPIGGYVFVSFPGCSSAIQAHPFSVASWQPGTLSVYIKDMGPGTWTHQIGVKAATGELARGMAAWATGPYGRVKVPVIKARTLILAAGGIGVTPILSIVGKILEGQITFAHTGVKILFVWVVRSATAVDPFLPVVSNFANTKWGYDFHQLIYCTSSPRPQRYPYHVSQELVESQEPRPIKEDGPASTEKGKRSKKKSVQFKEQESTTLLSNAQRMAGGADIEDGAAVDMLNGRPDWNQILREHGVLMGAETTLFTCGPAPLVASLEALSRRLKFNFHEEVFLF